MRARNVTILLSLVGVTIIMYWWSTREFFSSAPPKVSVPTSEMNPDVPIVEEFTRPKVQSLTDIPGPKSMMSLYNQCFSYSTDFPDSENFKYDLCLYKSVRRTSYRKGYSYSLGFFDRWEPSTFSKNIYQNIQSYRGGDTCDNEKDHMSTRVLFQCDPKSSEVTITGVSTDDNCHYTFRVSAPQWCETLRAGEGTNEYK